ncbi:hypothetical protein T4D_2935 [Trichinella pseudospiralis]|uniref:Uncharacterized protein n=1 Tax=Trichinella pseudospiralis TaxID=6337 RepID=A0A0V1FML7_TRIPS|nr:hypothetical protein T4D_2935 [Trichinella pseudospiralis]
MMALIYDSLLKYCGIYTEFESFYLDINDYSNSGKCSISIILSYDCTVNLGCVLFNKARHCYLFIAVWFGKVDQKGKF